MAVPENTIDPYAESIVFLLERAEVLLSKTSVLYFIGMESLSSANCLTSLRLSYYLPSDTLYRCNPHGMIRATAGQLGGPVVNSCLLLRYSCWSGPPS